jgi:hypothetical protein
MDSKRARDLYYKYRAAVAYVAVETPKGDQRIGTAFHVGDGIWVTAKHVVEGNKVLEIGTTEFSIADYGETLSAQHGVVRMDQCSAAGSYELVDDPLLHPDEDVDVAALRLDGPAPPDRDGPSTPIVPLGGWLDDWLGDELTLEQVLVLGYPPIPFGTGPLLVAVTAEINTVLDRRDTRHPHFILSATPRGGFSGALPLVEFEAALGVTTASLGDELPSPTLGYFAVISVEPIYDCLDHHGVLPETQRIGL